MSEWKRGAKKAERADRKASHKAARKRRHPVVQALGFASEVADQPPLRVIGVAMVIGGAVLRRRPIMAAGLRMLATHHLANRVRGAVKARFDRTRPERAIADGYRFEAGRSTDSSLRSFPSGHSAGAMAAARAVGHELPGVAMPALLAAGGAAAMQVPRAKHYVGDVVAGVLIGLAADLAVGAAMRMLAPKDEGRRGAAPPPVAIG